MKLHVGGNRLRRFVGLCAFIAVSAWLGPSRSAQPAVAQSGVARLNIVFLIADDWSWPHAGAYGDRVARTPTFDQLAREGARFTHAFAAAPSCTPSRASLLTGRAVHALGEGANLWSTLPSRYATYTDLLEQAGYVAGFTRKGWGPGDVSGSGRRRNPAGDQFASFDAFMATRDPSRPFVFWFGSQDPHRPYEPGAATRAGLKTSDVVVPPFLPDTADVRTDMLDYYFEVERFDREAGEIVARLRSAGLLDQTLVVMSSDNGMPFPRAKANVYDAGARLPLAVRWPAVVQAGRVIDDFVVLTDLAPTFLEAAGLPVPADMDGRSWMPLFRGQTMPGRDRVFLERERHAHVRAGNLGYPIRAVRTREFLYIRNLRPDRWPAGDPERVQSVGPYGDIDSGLSKDVLLAGRNDPQIGRFFDWAMAKRPGEELYDVRADPGQLTNLADRAEYGGAKRALRASLDQWMQETGDPRASQDDDRFDRYPYFSGPATVPRPSK
jgi:arylsulfatase A-like enzyme